MRSQTIICLGWITVSPMVFLTGESISVARQLPQTNVATAAKLTPTLGIYLFSGQVKFQGQAPWDLKMANVPLEADPAVADYDFASFDTNSYKFSLTAEAAKRLSRRLATLPGWSQPERNLQGGMAYSCMWPDTPFVLEVDGMPIYIGMFSCNFCSMAYTRTPVIKAKTPAIDVQATNNVNFQINFDKIEKSVIDPRSDSRIINAVRRLFGDLSLPST